MCQACVRRACDVSLSGGFVAHYVDSGRERHSHVCTIDGVRCRADEAHVGGIVVQVAAED